VGDSGEHANEASGTIKGGKFLDWLPECAVSF
jgi:hypothetical protein